MTFFVKTKVYIYYRVNRVENSFSSDCEKGDTPIEARREIRGSRVGRDGVKYATDERATAIGKPRAIVISKKREFKKKRASLQNRAS